MFALAAGCAFRQQRQATRFTLPDDVVLRKVDILSEGARMGGEVCSLKSMAGKKLPTIVMSHGWGGTVGCLRRDATAFAHAGYLVIAFDCRGWGSSDSRVIHQPLVFYKREQPTNYLPL